MSFSFPQVGHSEGIWLKSFSMVPVLVPDELLSCRRGWQVGAGERRVGQNVFPAFLLETLPVYGFLDGIKTATFPF